MYISKNKRYNNDKLLKLMVCTSYQEMESVVKGDDRLMTLVEKLKELGEDSEIISIYTAKDDMEFRLADAENYGEAIGEERGEKRGRSEGRTEAMSETARNMLKDGLPISQIKKYTGMSDSAVKALM